MIANENTSTATIIAAVAAVATKPAAIALVEKALVEQVNGSTNEARTLAVRAAMAQTGVNHGALALAAI